MRGLLIASACLAAAAIALAAALRTRARRRSSALILRTALAACVLYAACFAALRGPEGWVEFSNGLLMLILALHSFWCSVYMARGGLARVLERLERAGESGLAPRELFAGPDPIRPRLARLVAGGYLRRRPGGALLTPAGARYARLSRLLRVAFAAGPGG